MDNQVSPADQDLSHTLHVIESVLGIGVLACALIIYVQHLTDEDSTLWGARLKRWAAEKQRDCEPCQRRKAAIRQRRETMRARWDAWRLRDGSPDQTIGPSDA